MRCPGEGLRVEGSGIIEDGLDNAQHTVMATIISGITGDGFDGIGGVIRGEGVFCQLQHFDIVAAIVDGRALLGRKVPTFEQAADAVGSM